MAYSSRDLTIGSSDRGSRLRSGKEEVDDWDKVPSFDAGKPSRRSTSSLEFTEAPLTPHEILAVCSRTTALIWGTYAIHRVPELFVHIDYPPIDNRASVLLLTAIQLSACLFLWFFSGTVARKLLPIKNVTVSSPPRLMDWQILGLVLIGVWELVQALPRLVYWVVVLNTQGSADYGFASLTPGQKGQLLWTISQLAIGIWLMFAARGIAARLFGTHKGDPSG